MSTVRWIVIVALAAAVGELVSPQDLIDSPAMAAMADAPPGDAAAAKPAVHVVQPGDLTLTVRRDGRVESTTRQKIRFAPEAYAGMPRVLEVLKHSGPVTQGTVLVRLDPQDMERTLRATREALDDARRSQELARQELEVQRDANTVAMERATEASLDAHHAGEIFQRYESASMLKSSDLQLRSQENWLDDSKEELAQLESMYKGTELATDTKEIVLNRARRGVRIGEENLAIARDNHVITKEYRHPDRQRDVANALRWTTSDLDRLKVSTRLADIRAHLALENAERSVRDTTERLERLQRDRALAELIAPADGVVSAIDLQPGDPVSVNQVIAELHQPQHLVVRFQAAEEDLRVLNVGRDVRLTLPAMREVALSGHVSELGLIGTPAGDSSTNFPCEITIDKSSTPLRIGQRCAVQADSIIKAVLPVPRKAVESRGDKTYAKVWRDGASHEVELVLGGGNEVMVQAVSGLKAGDEVVLPADAKEKSSS